ncbi:hypothetical protein JQ543_05455 [Bradyrhizobium diazoefficiens]|nr:hypothetical protein [Bradyrhizobium diazoefficiens]
MKPLDLTDPAVLDALAEELKERYDDPAAVVIESTDPDSIRKMLALPGIPPQVRQALEQRLKSTQH